MMLLKIFKLFYDIFKQIFNGRVLIPTVDAVNYNKEEKFFIRKKTKTIKDI